ncbi:SPOR domain-containing protein [Neotamlana laminarinivorans]|uniref:SPOR domain-containing protein n=1 Tax=Neotamlana laminarinivorans TaxID=2883124 RepID=A0A9X1I3R7_9FLAO|nr:SPOR domain-containing protein [Tamlana laminarinivorans]MCB4799867.1 SPOR domain-containing protein [Tamlana laminarinivorans]
MKVLKKKTLIITASCCFITSFNAFAQEGEITLNQDKKIETLLEIKKELNKNETDSERYKIQVYNGNRNGAKSAQSDFEHNYGSWKASMQFESPDFKVWAGNFRTRLEAERALKKIKNTFPNAFILKPKKS